MRVTFTVPYNWGRGKGRPPVATPTKGSYRAPVAGVIKNDNPQTKAWEKLVRTHAMVARPRDWPMGCAVFVDLFFGFRRPKTCKREFPKTKPDMDKLERPIFDALKGVFYPDDCYPCDKIIKKRYADGGPFVTITCEPME